MRRQFLFDGLAGGTLSVIESTTPDQITLRFEQAEQVCDLTLTEEDFRQLSELRFKVRFVRPESPQLRVA
jgi:hypothetical protein